MWRGPCKLQCWNLQGLGAYLPWVPCLQHPPGFDKKASFSSSVYVSVYSIRSLSALSWSWSFLTLLLAMQWAYRQSCLRWQRPHQLHSSCLLYHSRRKYSLPLELLLSLQFSFLRSSIVDLLTIQLFCNQNCSPFWSSFVVKLRTNFPSRNCKFNFLAFPTAEMKACWPRCTSQVSGQAFLTLTFLPIQGRLCSP